ncbi:hypothetical protein Q5752_000158 [Cryptotrichosporon argae]
MSQAKLHTLIAHYLATNYPSALAPFLSAAAVPAPDPAHPPTPDLRTLVSDHLSASLAADVSSLTVSTSASAPAADDWSAWSLADMARLELAPEVKLDRVGRTIDGVSASNLLTVDVRLLPTRTFDTRTAEYRAAWHRRIITSSVDRTLKVLDYETGDVDAILEPHRAPVLCFDVHPVNPRYIVTGSMDGTTVLTDLLTSTPLQTFQSLKFVVRALFSPDGHYLTTASYDHTLTVYAATAPAVPPLPTTNEDKDEDDVVPLDPHDDARLACDPTLRYAEVRKIRVESNPETVCYAGGWLMYTLRDSHLLHYVRLPPVGSGERSGGGEGAEMDVDADADADADADTPADWETRNKSFNPHPMDSHVSFAVLDLQLHPSGRLLACLTGDHRGGTGERILLYGAGPDETERLACLWTAGAADEYVLPRMSWLPDGSGLITTAPTGHLHLTALTGESRASLKAHGAAVGTPGVGPGHAQATSEVVRDCVVVPVGPGADAYLAHARGPGARLRGGGGHGGGGGGGSGPGSEPESEPSAVEKQRWTGAWEVVSVGYDRRVRISR